MHNTTRTADLLDQLSGQIEALETGDTDRQAIAFLHNSIQELRASIASAPDPSPLPEWADAVIDHVLERVARRVVQAIGEVAEDDAARRAARWANPHPSYRGEFEEF